MKGTSRRVSEEEVRQSLPLASTLVFFSISHVHTNPRKTSHLVNFDGMDRPTWRKIVAVVRDVVIVVVVVAVAADAVLVVEAVIADHSIVWSSFFGGNQGFQLLVILVQPPQTLLIQAARGPVSAVVSKLSNNLRF